MGLDALIMLLSSSLEIGARLECDIASFEQFVVLWCHKLRTYQYDRSRSVARTSIRKAGLLNVDKVSFGSTIGFCKEKLMLLRCGYVRELAAASYPHIHGGGGEFPCIAGGGRGGWRLI